MIVCAACKGKGYIYKRDGDNFGLLGFGILNILDRMINTRYKSKCKVCNGNGYILKNDKTKCR